MARSRSNTATLTKDAHSISLKVLRLSKPSLTQQTPLSKSNVAGISQTASLAYPSKSIDGDFILTPILSLPPSFGSAYVGETFSCAIVANNEIEPTASAAKVITGLRIAAEMQTPTQTLPLKLRSASTATGVEPGEQNCSEAGSSLQQIVEFALREEGNHTLIVAVHYTEQSPTEPSPSGDPSASTSSAAAETKATEQAAPAQSRQRTFRKMYQFPTTPCLSVRTKATELPAQEIAENKLGDPYARTTLLRYILEAQLENVSEARITLETAQLITKPPFKAVSVNEGLPTAATSTSGPLPPLPPEALDTKDASSGSLGSHDSTPTPAPEPDQVVLEPRSIHQIAFLVSQQPDITTGVDELKGSLKAEGRTVLGQITLTWRSFMGERGSLSTGNLMTRRRQ